MPDKALTGNKQTLLDLYKNNTGKQNIASSSEMHYNSNSLQHDEDLNLLGKSQSKFVL